MRIESINIPEDPISGLGKIKMNRLDQVVVLAGKNGSGKTRILHRIHQEIKADIGNNKINNIKSQLRNFESQLEHLKINQGTTINENSKHFIERIEGLNKLLASQRIIFKDHKNTLPISFVPKTLSLEGSDNKGISDLETLEHQSRGPGINNLFRSTYATIQSVQNQWWESSHPSSTLGFEKKEHAKNRYDKLNHLIKTFFGVELGRDARGRFTLFNRTSNQLQLSDGEKVLLQLCIAIFSQDKSLENLILFLDEPENHLHPKALNDTIKRIIECVPNGQVWIATHSVSLLSQFDPNSIWYVADGNIKHAGKAPEIVLNSLLGDKEDVNRLQDFLSLPAQYATSRYASECLLEPAVLMTSYNDPQTRQINKVLKNINKDNQLKVLDFGAGKGRLLSNLIELATKEEGKAIEGLQYVAYDKYESDKAYCVAEITKVYGSADQKYYNDFETLRTDHGDKSFDVIVMCNVLHEIKPTNWIKLFKAESELNKILNDNGYLLIVEDNQIPHGEKAFTEGFTVLDTLHLKKLFQINNISDLPYDSEKEGRLKAHLIKKEFLKNISSKTLKDTLEEVKESSLSNILKIRESGNTAYVDGRLHGFYSQQATNAILILNSLD